MAEIERKLFEKCRFGSKVVRPGKEKIEKNKKVEPFLHVVD